MENGLYNKGQKNCFLNSIVQVIGHLECFRERLLAENWTQEGCLAYELKNVLSLLLLRQGTVNPVGLRAALKDVGSNGAFDIKRRADPAEALEEILLYLHRISVNPELGRLTEIGIKEELNDAHCEEHCISHLLFGSEGVDTFSCLECGFSTKKATRLLSFPLYIEDMKAAYLLDKQCDFYALLRPSIERVVELASSATTGTVLCQNC